MTGTSIFHRWQHILQRCYDTKCDAYPNYGGRGITVCERWKNFENFFKDIGLPPGHGYTIDRKNNDGPYSPDNCRWATAREQANNKRSCRFITFNGQTLNYTQWEKKLGFAITTLHRRIHKYGWSIERAITTKPDIRFASAIPGKRITIVS